MIKVFPILLFLFLGGCALPLPLQIASWVADGLSYIATDKSITDHGISMVMNRDCSLLHIVTRGEICSDEDYIGFAAVFRDFNGAKGSVSPPGPDAVPATPPPGTPPSTVMATNNNLAKVASNDDVDMELAGFVTASGASSKESSPAVTCVAKLDVNVRARPGAAAYIKKVLLKNESVKCLDEKDGWRMVEFATTTDGNTIYGWVDGEYLGIGRQLS